MGKVDSYKEGRRIVSVSGMFLHETDKAEYVEFGTSQGSKSIWLPKSQMGKATEIHNAETGECTLYIPLWLAEKNDIDYEDVEKIDLGEEAEADIDSYANMMNNVNS